MKPQFIANESVGMSNRFLVAIVDATRSYIKFGLAVSASAQTNSSVISVYYADEPPSSGTWDSPASSWTVPSLVGRWTSIIVRARGQHISLFLDCRPVAPRDVQVSRRSHGLTFNTGSIVYVAQAGPQFGQHFEVSLYIVILLSSYLPGCRPHLLHICLSIAYSFYSYVVLYPFHKLYCVGYI